MTTSTNKRANVMGNVMGWKPARFLPIMALLSLLQGCVAAAWLCAVGLGSSMSSSVDFQPFQNSWVAPAETREATVHIDSIGIAPFEGDKEMGERFFVMFQARSTLSVQNVADPPVGAGESSLIDDQDDVTTESSLAHAQNLARDQKVDCVLIGKVVGEPGGRDKWSESGKEMTSKRLLLQLVHSDGSVIWKDELPFTITKGLQPIPEQWIQDKLTDHVIAHTDSLGLTNLLLAKNLKA